ncbi:unnamed protein product, partial [marine sediment metagenome]
KFVFSSQARPVAGDGLSKLTEAFNAFRGI